MNKCLLLKSSMDKFLSLNVLATKLIYISGNHFGLYLVTNCRLDFISHVGTDHGVPLETEGPRQS